MSRNIKAILILCTLFLGLLIRLYKINSPIADWHSFRQADTASVTQNFLKHGINILVPTYHDLSNLQSGQENPSGYRMVEVPLYNLISLGTHKAVQFFNTQANLDFSSRLTTVIISLINSLLIFIFVKGHTKKFFPAYFSTAVFLFLPFSIYYSRVILPEQLAIFFLLLSLVLFQKVILLSAISLALSFLIKPYTGLIAFPIYVYLSYIFYLKNIKIKNILLLITFILVSLIPFLLWRLWIQKFSAGIPQSDWLLWTDPKNQRLFWFHGYNLTWLVSMVPFKPYWFRWVFYQRITLLILGSFGLIPLFLGFAYKDKQIQKINFLSLVGMIIYFIVIAGGNVRHDYYQVLIIPFLSITLGSGLFYISQFLFSSKLVSFIFLFLVSSFTFLSSWSQVKDYYIINNPNIIDAGTYVDSRLPQNALIVAPYNGDTAFLYQTKRSGWPIEIYDFDTIRKSHPQNSLYLVSTVNDTYTNNVATLYSTLIKNDKFIIIDLTHENKK